MFNIGIIGAGSVSVRHINGYKQNSECNIKAIADLNVSLAGERAKEYGIDAVYQDYKELLADEEIDAVSVVTPTFTHKEIVIEALRSGKHVLCEKPPAMNSREVRECEAAAKKYGKLLMFGFVVRFRSQVQYLKEYIDAGFMGEIISAECGRVARCEGSEGWFLSREKGGGCLIDSAIHELDSVLYLMNYPEPTYVLASQTFVNSDLYEKMNGKKSAWASMDKKKYERTIESGITGFVTFKNGACLSVKAATILNSVNTGVWLDISGSKAGARMETSLSNYEDWLKMLELKGCDGFVEFKPCLKQTNVFNDEIDHFVDCCLRGTECICKVNEAIILMDIINAIYKSADTGKPVVF